MDLAKFLRNYMNKLQKTISKYTDKKYKILDSFGSKLNATHSNELLNFIIKSTNQSQEIFHRNMWFKVSQWQ